MSDDERPSDGWRVNPRATHGPIDSLPRRYTGSRGNCMYNFWTGQRQCQVPDFGKNENIPQDFFDRRDAFDKWILGWCERHGFRIYDDTMWTTLKTKAASWTASRDGYWMNFMIGFEVTRESFDSPIALALVRDFEDARREALEQLNNKGTAT